MSSLLSDANPDDPLVPEIANPDDPLVPEIAHIYKND